MSLALIVLFLLGLDPEPLLFSLFPASVYLFLEYFGFRFSFFVLRDLVFVGVCFILSLFLLGAW